MKETTAQVVYSTYGQQIEMDLPTNRGFKVPRQIVDGLEDIEGRVKGVVIKNTDDTSEASSEAQQISHYAKSYKINYLIQEAEKEGRTNIGEAELWN